MFHCAIWASGCCYLVCNTHGLPTECPRIWQHLFFRCLDLCAVLACNAHPHLHQAAYLHTDVLVLTSCQLLLEIESLIWYNAGWVSETLLCGPLGQASLTPTQSTHPQPLRLSMAALPSRQATVQVGPHQHQQTCTAVLCHHKLSLPRLMGAKCCTPTWFFRMCADAL